MGRMEQLPAQGTDGHAALLGGVSPIVPVELVLALVPDLVLAQLEPVRVHPTTLFHGVRRYGGDGEDPYLLVEGHAPGGGGGGASAAGGAAHVVEDAAAG